MERISDLRLCPNKKHFPKDAKKKRLVNLLEHPETKWAIFTRSPSGSKAYFRCIIDSQEVGVEVARQYASEHASKGLADFTYYVVEIKHRVGIENGKPVDTST